jgi:hypothetical protein
LRFEGPAGAVEPNWYMLWPNFHGNPYFNPQKEVLVMKVVPTLGDERTELLPLGRLG